MAGTADRFKKKATENAREEMGEERAEQIEEWVGKLEDDHLNTDQDWVPRRGEFFLLFDALRLRGVDKSQAARTAQQLVAPVAPIHVEGRE